MSKKPTFPVFDKKNWKSVEANAKSITKQNFIEKMKVHEMVKKVCYNFSITGIEQGERK